MALGSEGVFEILRWIHWTLFHGVTGRLYYRWICTPTVRSEGLLFRFNKVIFLFFKASKLPHNLFILTDVLSERFLLLDNWLVFNFRVRGLGPFERESSSVFTVLRSNLCHSCLVVVFPLRGHFLSDVILHQFQFRPLNILLSARVSTEAVLHSFQTGRAVSCVRNFVFLIFHKL